jgi:hypothetical protein
MGAELLGLIFTAIGCTAAATSAIVWSIAGVKSALAVHVAENEAEHKSMGAEIIELKKRKRR